MDFYPTYMVTLISIIQAAALGYLLLAVRDQLSQAFAGTYDPLWTIFIVAMFIMIVATWLQYTRGVIAARFVPSTIGAVIPFLFGVTQALVIFCITLQQVAAFYFAFFLNALVGFVQSVSFVREVKLNQDCIENRVLLSRLGPTFRTTVRMMGARAVIEALFRLNSLVLAVILLASNVVMIVGVHRNTNEMLGG